MAVSPSTEPVSLYAAVTAAVSATINLLGLLFNWSAELIAALNLCLLAWVGVGAWYVRTRVTPYPRPPIE